MKRKKGVKLQALYFYSPDLTSLIKFKNLKLASLWNAKEHGRAFRKALSSSGDSSGEQTKMLNIRGYFKHIKQSITGQGGGGGGRERGISEVVLEKVTVSDNFIKLPLQLFYYCFKTNPSFPHQPPPPPPHIDISAYMLVFT